MTMDKGRSPATADAAAPREVSDGQRALGLALLVIAAAQLMNTLDNTIVNIALPSIRSGLTISTPNLAWVVTGYALPFGGLLLVGGRAGDLFGRRRVFRGGLILFAIASLISGFAPNQSVLITGRVLQGAAAAIAAPTALSLLTTTFPAGEPRNKALGVYGAMGGLGSTLGLVLGGVLTEYLDWRWVFFVNVPIAVAVLAGTHVLLGGERDTGSIDYPGAITVAAGMSVLVYAITHASSSGWSDSLTITLLIVGVLLLLVFVFIETRSRAPMLPSGVVRDRTRVSANLSFLLIGAGMFGTYYFLTLYMQVVKGYSAVETGLAYLPMALGMAVSAGGIGPKLLGRFSPKVVVAGGALVGVIGMCWFSSLAPHSSYPAQILPAMIISGLGLGMAFVAATIAGIGGVAPQDSGAAAGLINTSQQIGGSIGLALLNTIALEVTNAHVSHGGHPSHGALTDGYSRAFLVGGACYLVAMIVALIGMSGRPAQPPQFEAAGAEDGQTDEAAASRY